MAGETVSSVSVCQPGKPGGVGNRRREIWDTTAKPNGWPDGPTPAAETPWIHRCATGGRAFVSVRIELADRPGSLGSLAGRARLGERRHPLFDVVERGNNYAMRRPGGRTAPGSDARHADHCCRGERRPGRRWRPVGSPPRGWNCDLCAAQGARRLQVLVNEAIRVSCGARCCAEVPAGSCTVWPAAQVRQGPGNSALAADQASRGAGRRPPTGVPQAWRGMDTTMVAAPFFYRGGAGRPAGITPDRRWRGWVI